MAKRIIIGNTEAQGSLDNDRVARPVLQYWNTPIQNIGLSLAQLLFHRRVRDFVPSQPTLYKLHVEWIAAARNCEKSLSWHNARLIEQYNCTAHTLCPFYSFYAAHEQWSVEYNRPGRRNSPSQPIPDQSQRIREDNLAETQSLCNPISNSKSYKRITTTTGERWKQSTSVANYRQWNVITTTPATKQYQPATRDDTIKACSGFISSTLTTSRDWRNLLPPKDHCSYLMGEGEI